MIKIALYTFAGLAAIYFLQRPSLKKANGMTRWASIAVLAASGALWVYLRLTIQIPRPADWIEAVFSPFVPVP